LLILQFALLYSGSPDRTGRITIKSRHTVIRTDSLLRLYVMYVIHLYVMYAVLNKTLQRILSVVDDAAHCIFTVVCNASHYIHHIPTGVLFV